jgi:outer membrane lipoprotein-sorting protein
MKKTLAAVRFLVLLLALPTTGCLLRSHRIEHAPMSDSALRSATASELVRQINHQAADIKTLSATVDIATTIGGVKAGKVTEYQEIRGYILVRQPGLLRMTGLMPVVRTRAFDMVSDGAAFRLYVPPKNRLYLGRNDSAPSNPPDRKDLASGGTAGLASLRPQIIYDALLLNDIDPKEDIAVLESGLEPVTDRKSRKRVHQPDYRLNIIHRTAGEWFLERRIYFNRADLMPRRLRVYDKKGELVSDIQYDKWQSYGDLWFPGVIEIERPVEEYRITIGMVKLDLNQPLTEKQFELTTPEGTAVVPVGNGNDKPNPSPSRPATVGK